MLSEGDPPGHASELLERRIPAIRGWRACYVRTIRLVSFQDFLTAGFTIEGEECAGLGVLLDDADRGRIVSHLILRLGILKRAGPHKLRPRLHYSMHNNKLI